MASRSELAMQPQRGQNVYCRGPQGSQIHQDSKGTFVRGKETRLRQNPKAPRESHDASHLRRNNIMAGLPLLVKASFFLNVTRGPSNPLQFRVQMLEQ